MTSSFAELAGRQAASALSQSISIPSAADNVPMNADGSSVMELSDYLTELVAVANNSAAMASNNASLVNKVHSIIAKIQFDKPTEPVYSSVGLVQIATPEVQQDQGVVRASVSFAGKASSAYSREESDDRSSTPAPRDENVGPASGEWAANSWTNDWVWPGPESAYDSTKVMWEEGALSECPLATHILYVAANVNKSKLVPFKFNIQPLTRRAEYENWEKDLQHAIGESGLFFIIERLVNEPQRFVRTDCGKSFGKFKFKDTKGELEEGTLNCSQVVAFEELGNAVKAAIKEDAVANAYGAGVPNLVTILRSLRANWGPKDNATHSKMSRRFHCEKWDGQLALKEWMIEKEDIAEKISHLLPPETLNENILYAILNNLPDRFEDLENDILNSDKQNLQNVRYRILAFEDEYREQNQWNNYAHSKGKDNKGKGSKCSKSSRWACNYCGEDGHWKNDCPKKWM